VIIPARNAECTLDRQLEALAQQDFREPWEIVVVDNGSTDGTRELVESWQAKLCHLRLIHEPRPGVNRARNAGVAAARADRILLCDADDIVDAAWVRVLTSTLDEFDLLAGRLDYELLNTDHVRARTLARPLAEGLAVSWRRPWGMTCNLGFHRRVFDDLDGFDPAFERGGSDDVDFCLRACAAGFSFGFASDAVVHYRMRARPLDHARQLYHYARASELLYRKHRARGALDAYPPRTRWNLNTAQAFGLVCDLTKLGSRIGRERYLVRTARFVGGIAGIVRHREPAVTAVEGKGTWPRS